MNLVCPTTGLRVIPLRLSSYRMIQKGLSSLPSDLILYSLLDQAYTFKNICYIVNPSLLNLKLLCCFVQVYTLVFRLLNKSNELASELPKAIVLPGSSSSEMTHWKAIFSLIELGVYLAWNHSLFVLRRISFLNVLKVSCQALSLICGKMRFAYATTLAHDNLRLLPFIHIIIINTISFRLNPCLLYKLDNSNKKRGLK